MRRWTVEGADSKSGVDRIISVEALTRDEAEQAAQKEGLVVADVHLSSLETQPLAAVGGGATAKPLSYRAAGPTGQEAPNYPGLLVGSVILRIFAIVYYVIGGGM